MNKEKAIKYHRENFESFKRDVEKKYPDEEYKDTVLSIAKAATEILVNAIILQPEPIFKSGGTVLKNIHKEESIIPKEFFSKDPT